MNLEVCQNQWLRSITDDSFSTVNVRNLFRNKFVVTECRVYYWYVSNSDCWRSVNMWQLVHVGMTFLILIGLYKTIICHICKLCITKAFLTPNIHWMSLPSCFIFRRSWTQIQAQSLTVLTEISEVLLTLFKETPG